MTKIVLDTVQAPVLNGRVSGEQVVLRVVAIVEASNMTEAGYVQYVLDVKSVEALDQAQTVEEAGERAMTEIGAGPTAYPG